MRVLIVSDTHGIETNFYEVLRQVGKIDFLIHAGDTSGSELDIKASVDCDSKIVLGNNDFSRYLKYEEEFDLAGYHILLTHGHREGVYRGVDGLFYKAAERGADIVVFGHTHVPCVEYDEDLNIYAVNPGSLTYPRQEGHRPSYILMNIDSNGDVNFDIKYL